MSSSSPLVIPIPPNIAAIASPMLLGKCISFFLFGVLAAQIYSYNYNFPEDRKRVKILVYGVFLLECVQTGMSIAEVYYWYGAGFGDLMRLQSTYISPFDTPLMTSFVSFVVQTFYCYRIWILKPSLLWLSLIVACISLAQAIAGIIGSIDGYHIHFAQAHAFVVPTYIWLIGDAVADLLIVVVMVWLLATFRSLENSYTSRVMSKVLRLCVESNLASATVALLALVLYVAMPGQAYFLAPTMVLGKIYSNTLLVSLNNRVALRDAASTATSSVFVHRHSVSVHPPPTDSHATNRTVVLQCDSLGEVQTPYEKYSLNSAERGVALELSTMDSHN